MSLYANDYNKNLANNLNQVNYALAKRSKLTNTKNELKGGSVMRSTDNKNMYIQDLQQVGNKNINSGNGATYPFLNMNEIEHKQAIILWKKSPVLGGYERNELHLKFFRKGVSVLLSSNCCIHP